MPSGMARCRVYASHATADPSRRKSVARLKWGAMLTAFHSVANILRIGERMSKKDDTADTQSATDKALAERREQRLAAHSIELRQVMALEQIADELTQLRLALPPAGK